MSHQNDFSYFTMDLMETLQPLRIACSTCSRSQPFHPLRIVTAPAHQAVRFLGREGSWLPNMLSSPGPRSLPPCHAIASPKRLAQKNLFQKCHINIIHHSFSFHSFCIPFFFAQKNQCEFPHSFLSSIRVHPCFDAHDFHLKTKAVRLRQEPS